MTDPRKKAQEQAEAGFEGFIKYSKYGLYGSIAFFLWLLLVTLASRITVFPLTTANNTLRQFLQILEGYDEDTTHKIV